jgi:2-furoate---CoA ligase
MTDLGATFKASVEREPHALALVDGPLRLTYAQWQPRIADAANSLRRLGVRPGDRVLTVLQNGEPMCSTYWACQLLGATIVPVNWRLSEGELTYIAHDAEPRCAVVDANSPSAQRAVSDLPAIGIRGAGKAAASDAFESRAGQDVLSGAELTEPLEERTPSIMLYTSGTTGRPKGVPRTHLAERAAAIAHIAQNSYRRNEVTLGVMPLYHTMGIRSLIAMTLLNGTYVAMARWEPRLALELIERERVSNLYLAPTLYYDLLALPRSDARDLRTLRKIGYAGAPMTPTLVERCYERFAPDVFVNHYGSTEIYTFTISSDPRRKPGCVGRAGLNERVRIVPIGSRDAEAGCAPREVGEIIVDMNSPEAFAGYWRRPDADARSIAGGWYYTGDTGMFDEDGELFVMGRVDDMIVTGGENVYPVEVEDALARCDAVGRIAVIGLPDERLGEKIVAFVEPARSGVTAEELEAFAGSCGMTQFKRPREFIFVRKIPQSASGKVLRTKLRAGEYERLEVSGMLLET